LIRLLGGGTHKLGRFRLSPGAALAGYFLICLLAGATLLHGLLQGSSRETASPPAAVLGATVEAPEPVAAAPKAAVPNGDASVTAAAQVDFTLSTAAEPAPAAVAGQSSELAARQAAEGSEPATESAAPDAPVTASLPRAGEIGPARKDAVSAASPSAGTFLRVPGAEAADTVTAAKIQVIPAAPAVSAAATGLSDPEPQAPALPMTPPPLPASGATKATAPVGEISAKVEPAPAPPTVEPPPVAASIDNAPPTTVREPVSEARAALKMPPPSSNATDPTAPGKDIVTTAEPAPAPRTDEPPPSAEVAVMVRRGYQLLVAGDIISARRFFERAAEAGDAAAACGLGRSFDPLSLRQMGVRGLSGDLATAIRWYRKAAEAGSREAQRRLQQLGVGQPELSIQNKG